MSRLRQQHGFTLPELLVAMTIGLMTVIGAYTVLETSMKQTTNVAGRVNATQRGRIAMDVITRQLRSQVCYSATVPALVSGTPDSVKFHADLSDGSKPIQQREIVFNPTARTITERVWPGSGSPLAFPTMTVNRLLVDQVARRIPSDPTPVFRYYAYDLNDPPRPDLELPTPLSTTDLARVAKIEVGFVALPPGERMPANGKLPRGASALQNEIYVRVADPNDPAPTPTCA